jgi:hypothetical protein
VAPSPRMALRANSGTGSQEGRPKMAPSRSHISAIRTGFGAVPLITPAVHHVGKTNSYQFFINTVVENTTLFYDKYVVDRHPSP